MHGNFPHALISAEKNRSGRHGAVTGGIPTPASSANSSGSFIAASKNANTIAI